MHIGKINIKRRVYNYYLDILIKRKILEIKNILINEKICFTRYVYSKSIKRLSLHYYELMGKTEEHEGKQYFTGHG